MTAVANISVRQNIKEVMNMAEKEKKKKKKITFTEEVECPWCEKHVVVTQTKERISEPVKAEYAEDVTVEKSEQTRLEE